MHDFEYNGKSLRSLGFCIANTPFYSIANRKFDIIDIYGKDGGIISDNGYYENIEVSYEVNSLPWLVINDSTSELVRLFAEWLTFFDGDFKILRDTYNDGYFTKAICKGIDRIEFLADKCVATVINFIRYPFWYSDEGQKEIEYILPTTQGAEIKIFNPENYSAKPCIHLQYKQDVVLTVNDCKMNIKALFVGNENDIELDSESQSAYCGLSDMNPFVSCTSFPVLLPGWNTIKLTSDKTNAFKLLKIIPRWRRL